MFRLGANLREEPLLHGDFARGPWNLDIAEVECSQAGPQGQQPDQHPEIANAVDDERLVGRGRSGLPLDVKADQKVGANADKLPENEHHRHVSGDDDAQHAEAEQR